MTSSPTIENSSLSYLRYLNPLTPIHVTVVSNNKTVLSGSAKIGHSYVTDVPAKMLFHFLFSILIVWLIRLAETKNGVVYYISLTKPLSSCPGNSSCPPGQFCHTMNYLAEHSSEFFSPDHIRVTLIFMCGVHNYTMDLTVQNLHSFVMKEEAQSRENVVIDHQFVTQNGEPNCTLIQFFNVSFVNITNLTMRCPAINLKGSHIMVKSCYLYGYPGIK